ncbi:MAG: trypsin-like serine peptidase [Hyphomicrobiales bacterium]
MKKRSYPKISKSFFAYAGKIVVVAVLSFSEFSVANSQEKKLMPEGIIGDDDRVPMDSWDPPWNAIGRIFIQGFSRVSDCSATLIDPKIVATAAHCLFDFVSKKPVPASSVNFLAGWRREKYIAHSKSACLKINPNFKFERTPNSQRISNDFAFIILSEAIDVTPIPIHRAMQISKDDLLVHAGYVTDRQYILSVQEGCRVRFKEMNAYFTNCDTTKGASGGPLLVKKDGNYSVAAVMSALVGLKSAEGHIPLSAFSSIMHKWNQLDDKGM